MRGRLSDDVLNLDLGELLTVSVLLLVALAATLLEDDDLVALEEGDEDFGLNLGTGDGGSTDGYLTVVVEEENFVEFDAIALFVSLVVVGEVMDEDFAVLLDFELLTSNFYDCVHFDLMT